MFEFLQIDARPVPIHRRRAAAGLVRRIVVAFRGDRLAFADSIIMLAAVVGYPIGNPPRCGQSELTVFRLTMESTDLDGGAVETGMLVNRSSTARCR